MDRLRTSLKVFLVVAFTAFLWAPLEAGAADRGPANTSALVTPRLVSAIGGGSIKPGAPRATPSFSITDATGGGPRFPTRPEASSGPAREISGRTPTGWMTLVLAAIAFVAGATSTSIVGRHRARRSILTA